MYQPPHLNWAQYAMAPAHPGFLLSPRNAPSIVPVPSKYYSVCSPVAARMRASVKPPTALIPTLMTVHPAGQRAPIIGLSPVIRAPPHMIQRRAPPQLVSPRTIVDTRSASPTVSMSASRESQRRSLPDENLHRNESGSRQASPSIPLIDVADDDASAVVGGKRSASPTDYERRLKRQREISRSPELKKVHPAHDCMATPKKEPVKPSSTSSDRDKVTGHKLSCDIEVLYDCYKQSEDWLIRKMRLRNALHEIIKKIYPLCGLYMVGSSMTGLASKHSDLDLCLVISPSEINQQTEAITHLREVLKLLRHCDFLHTPQLIFAKVPILKFTDMVSGVEVDLNLNSVVGIRNTQLINNYSLLDKRIRPLCLTVKIWAKSQDINDPYNKTLSSYSLILMVLHYLQVGCDPPVLPCLHKLMPNHFSNSSDVSRLSLTLDLPSFSVRNTQCLGELFLGFLHYYGSIFNFEKKVISVRVGGTLPKEVAMNCRSPKNKPSQWNYICIEEPFDRTNTASSIFDKLAFKRILNAFSSSLETLRHTPNLDSVLCVDENS